MNQKVLHIHCQQWLVGINFKITCKKKCFLQLCHTDKQESQSSEEEAKIFWEQQPVEEQKKKKKKKGCSPGPPSRTNDKEKSSRLWVQGGTDWYTMSHDKNMYVTDMVALIQVI